jgi:hypothetical protein
MIEPTPEERARELAHRRLRVSMAAGSLYDVTFAIINLVVPEWGAWFLEIPMPEQQVYVRFTGVFLIALALFYMLPVIHPGRYLGNVVVAILARGAGAIFLITAALAFGQPPAFLLLGAGDLLFALLHVFFLWRAEGGNLLRHYVL